jgi:hypothetical protein
MIDKKQKASGGDGAVPGLQEEERDEAERRSAPSASVVYEAIRTEGESVSPKSVVRQPHWPGPV